MSDVKLPPAMSHPVDDLTISQLRAHVAELEAERDAARAQLAEECGKRDLLAEAANSLKDQLAEARAEVERLRPDKDGPAGYPCFNCTTVTGDGVMVRLCRGCHEELAEVE
jgi:hypothetical protein